MGKLKNIAPRVGTLAPRIARRTDAEGHNDRAERWRGWYHLARWKHPSRGLRARVLRRDLYTCQCGCGVGPLEPSRLVADHIEPHRGDPALFWDEDNVQTLRKSPCHDSLKQRQERGLGAGLGLGPARRRPGRMARPDWFRRVHVPLTVVCGPPGSGKSTWVCARAGPRDLVICFDDLATRRFGRRGAKRAQAGLSLEQVADVLRERNEMLGDLMRPAAKARWDAAWLIVSEPEAAHRQWWADTLGAEVVVLLTPAAECRRRVAADAEAGDERGEAAQASIDTWWRAYSPARCDRPPR